METILRECVERGVNFKGVRMRNDRKLAADCKFH